MSNMGIFEYPGAALGICGAGALLWYLGLRQPFVLAFLAVFAGGGLGYLAEVALGRALGLHVQKHVGGGDRK